MDLREVAGRAGPGHRTFHRISFAALPAFNPIDVTHLSLVLPVECPGVGRVLGEAPENPGADLQPFRKMVTDQPLRGLAVTTFDGFQDGEVFLHRFADPVMVVIARQAKCDPEPQPQGFVYLQKLPIAGRAEDFQMEFRTHLVSLGRVVGLLVRRS